MSSTQQGLADLPLAAPYDTAEQQREAAVFGMWVFLATEVLFFGGLFVGYVVYRYEYAAAFQAGASHLSVTTGAIMTAVLLVGSLLVALSDRLVREETNVRSAIVRNLSVTVLLGTLFLGLEFHEWSVLIKEGLFPGAGFDQSLFAGSEATGRSPEIFFCLFFCMTGLHAFHMIIGVIAVLAMAVVVHRSRQVPRHANLLENIGLYWHFVDIVWVFLFPLFYLVEA